MNRLDLCPAPDALAGIGFRRSPADTPPAAAGLPRLLAVGRIDLPEDVREAGADRPAPAWRPTLLLAAGDVQAARHLQRLARAGDGVDLVLIGPALAGDCDAWTFAARLRTARPWQAWALVAAADQVTPRGERYALSLGASGVFDGRRDFARLLEVARYARAARQC